MTTPAIKVANLSKRYRLGASASLDGSFREMLTATLGRTFRRFRGTDVRDTTGDFWALRDVSFDIPEGQVVGVVGCNGAGKSTLLKILSEITAPTTGRCEIRGRVASLLEVGTGFHPELSGRENVFLNGTILGMTAREVRAKFDQIVDFSGVEKFLDTPVKHYSSGMTVRLAFAVAAHLEPEILIIDEVLAVGDAAFQAKCLGKMSDVARQGRTVLFVSHNMRALRTLCTSALYLKAGRLVTHDAVAPVIARYNADTHLASPQLPLHADDLVIHAFDVRQQNQLSRELDGSRPFCVDVEFELLRDVTQFRLGVNVRTNLGDTLVRSLLADWDPSRESLLRGRYRAALDFPESLLMPGGYTLQLHASRFGLRNYLQDTPVGLQVAVTAPDNFNRAHMGEHVDALILMPRAWSLDRATPQGGATCLAA